MKHILSLTLLITSLFIYAQSNDILAKAAFMDAQNAYGQGQYTEAVNGLEEVVQLLGGSNPRVDYLLTESYYKLNDPFKAESSLKSYFDLAGESDANYNTMLGLIGQIKKQKVIKEGQIKKQKAINDERNRVAKALSERRSVDLSVGYSLQKGDVFIYEITQKTKSSVQEFSTAISTWQYEVLETGTNSIELKGTCLKNSFDFDQAAYVGQFRTMDNNKKFYSIFKGIVVRFRITNLGEVRDLLNADEVNQSLLQNTEALSASNGIKKQFQTSIAGMTEESWKTSLNMTFKLFPRRTVHVNDKWQMTTLVGTINQMLSYELTDYDDRVIKLVAKQSGKFSREVTVDRNTGLTTSAHVLEIYPTYVVDKTMKKLRY